MENSKLRFWKGLTEYIPKNSKEQVRMLEMDLEDVAYLSRKMGVNDYIVARTQFVNDEDANYFNKVINFLKRDYELDIGKGDAEFGYKMPLPEKNEDRRRLIIFRRRVGE